MKRNLIINATKKNPDGQQVGIDDINGARKWIKNMKGCKNAVYYDGEGKKHKLK